jgi:hypothetical protein
MTQQQQTATPEKCDFCNEGATRKKGPVLLNPPPHEARLHAECAKQLDEGDLL